MYTVDIDTGGTMTDGLVVDGGSLHAIKVDTTPHDLTVSFRQVLVEAARRLGHGDDLRAFLDHVDLIRWSTTITSNALGERRGAKVGLLVRAGHERDLYGDGPSPAVGTLVAERNVLGLPATPNSQDVLAAVRQLFEDGVRRICVSLDGAFPDGAGEKPVKRVIETQYPDHYLGAVPVLCGSDMAQVDDDATRTHCSLVNAYVHTRLASSLFTAEDMLRYDEGWDGPLLVGHINGGVARVGKTKAIDTIESGPVFGTFASAHFARRYGLDRVVCLDVGGTTAKGSIVRGREPVFTRDSDLFGIPVQAPLALLRSAVLGGGSVARPDGTGGIRLGPESMGAAPGPACYGLGGDEATVTDAFLVLGYLDPAGFFGGRRRLDVERSRQVLDRRVAHPLGVSVEIAARRIADAAIDIVAALITETLAAGGLSGEDVALFAYGGNGALFAAPVAERLGIPIAHVFALGPVFSAFGSAVSDVVHVYERSLGAPLGNGQGPEQVRSALEVLEATARRDLAAEGFEADRASIEAEVDLRLPDATVRMVRTDSSSAAARAIEEAAAASPPRSVVADVVRLRARYPVATCDLAPGIRIEEPPSPTGKRTLLLPGGATTAAVYDWAVLPPGCRISGPAVAAGATMTCLVPPDWVLDIDELGNGVLRRRDRGSEATERQR